MNAGLTVVPENGNHGQPSIAAAVAEYLEETRIGKKPRPFAAYSTALGFFVESCPQIFMADIACKDVLEFYAFLRDKKQQAQQWLGHSEIESTMRYLKPSHSQQVREKVNKIFS